ncbi:hypothetical protein GCM10010094_23890 [Streptomyces flaveus]|uniref:Uncharacterized protein n=1 Tax=Streptomyces flaveus TaxID=66370 RepID=A0A917QQR1_9ACTN|nr:hypothetical protein GCM10010094_23890 [Streptomyces flaveus]
MLVVVAELVTNAERHGGTVLRLSAGLGTVTGTVEDARSVLPRPRPADASEPGGARLCAVGARGCPKMIE